MSPAPHVGHLAGTNFATYRTIRRRGPRSNPPPSEGGAAARSASRGAGHDGDPIDSPLRDLHGYADLEVAVRNRRVGRVNREIDASPWLTMKSSPQGANARPTGEFTPFPAIEPFAVAPP